MDSKNKEELIIKQIKKFTDEDINIYYEMYKKLDIDKIKLYYPYKGKILYKKNILKYFSEYNNYILSKLDNRIIKYVENNYSINYNEVIWFLFIRGYDYKMFYDDIFKYEKYNIIKIWENGKFKIENKDLNFVKGIAMSGKKRPEHSDLMKSLHPKGSRIGKESLDKISNRLKSIDFKKKVLLNKKLINKEDLYTDQEIKEKYLLFNNELKKTDKYKINCIKNFIKDNKYEGFNIYDEFVLNNKDKDLSLLSTEEIDLLRYARNSIISTYHTLYNENMGTTKFFKKVTLYNLKNNIRGINILKLRSSYESNFVLLLEENNIKWDYETIILKNSDQSTYIVDFYVEYNKKKYIVELKGYITDKTFEKLKKCIVSGYEYVKTNDINFIFYNEKKHIDIEYIMSDKFLVTEENINQDLNKIIKYKTKNKDDKDKQN